ncbi:hypothetical protein QIS96_25655 [Streptomyces sp. B-S-A6]|uniref:Uncharacterized protein n=1 Tax=Streptomyces cavernicola TaxID=3043613 RepID=A0ABT6SHP5_9ACTN|nr:hypothetical protein [Streptomyces sp. B-S-A6]MDI3407182.1 hypothetical protein [Streptomyces sp. B-S-A6]
MFDGFPAAFGAGFDGGGDVDAGLGAEADVDGLAGEVGDHRFECGDRRFFHALDDGFDEGVFEGVEDLSDGDAGDGGGGHAGGVGESEGDDGCCGGGDDLYGEGDELDDDGDFAGDDEHGCAAEAEADDGCCLGCVLEVAVAAVVEFVVVLFEFVDGVAGVVGHDGGGAGGGVGAEVGDVLCELLPDFRALDEFVLVGGGPGEAEHLEDPLELVRQHHRHCNTPPNRDDHRPPRSPRRHQGPVQASGRQTLPSAPWARQAVCVTGLLQGGARGRVGQPVPQLAHGCLAFGARAARSPGRTRRSPRHP